MANRYKIKVNNCPCWDITFKDNPEKDLKKEAKFQETIIRKVWKEAEEKIKQEALGKYRFDRLKGDMEITYNCRESAHLQYSGSTAENLAQFEADISSVCYEFFRTVYEEIGRELEEMPDEGALEEEASMQSIPDFGITLLEEECSSLNLPRIIASNGRRFNIIGEEGGTIYIDDGIDETFSIARSDFDALNDVFNNDSREFYDNYFSSLGLGTTGYDIALTARELDNGSTDYSYEKKQGDFPANLNKCNKFVYDVLRQNNAIDEQSAPGCPPLAGTYANPKETINGLPVVSVNSSENIKLGDVIATGINPPRPGATGHVEIVTHINRDGSYSTTGAHSWGVSTTNGFTGINSNATVRRTNR